ncbi:protein phosphatase 2C domain-containing protein [Sphingomonas sp. MMS12-HWE2-04]|uniref:protein phosphatase 2C domain-containing protein n=1 Tax=Sphingomonas sp. MMS12-HWE2-04 TaxID=3234199 RepID=UPI00384A769B
MHFDVLQSVSLAGDLAVPNDDRAGAGHVHGWVIDGATDLGPPGLVGARGGAAWLANEAQAAFTASPAASLDTLYADVAAHILAAWERDRTREPAGLWERPLASALAVHLAGDGLDCGWLGDCAGFLWSKGQVTRLGPAKDPAEGLRAAALARHGLGSPKRSAPILADLRATRGHAGMRVLSVNAQHMQTLDRSRLACAPGDELFLMTDGFAALIDTYGVEDDASLVAAIRTRGLAAVAQALRAIEADDAACVRYPRFKTSDDATALWLRIGG